MAAAEVERTEATQRPGLGVPQPKAILDDAHTKNVRAIRPFAQCRKIDD